MLIQPDGKIIVVGQSDNWGEQNYALARYNSDGSLDTTFDYDGKVVTDIQDWDDGQAIALQADSKIVVAGDSIIGSNNDFSLARYNSDGSLDATFDGDGKVVTDIGGDNDVINAMLIQPDGRIVAAGFSNYLGNSDFALVRYLANNAPTDIALSNNTVVENQPTGTPIGNLSTTDPDAGDSHTYAFCGGADYGSFQLSGNQLQTAAVFDYETKNTYAICLRTDDGHGGIFDKDFTVNVLDVIENNPPTDISLSNNSVYENQAIDTFIGSFTTTDPDPGDNDFTYSFCGGPDDDAFVLTGDELLTGGPFDYEARHTYNICVRTDDSHGGAFDKNFTITILDIPYVELVAPENEEPAHTNRPAFQWNAYAGATNYLIQISTSSNFSSKVTKATLPASVTAYTPKKDLLRNTIYYWRISARVGGVYIPWSETWSFTTGNPPPIPVLTSPGNKKTVAGPSPLFDWKDVKTIPGVTFLYYKIQISTDAHFATIFGTGYSAESQYNSFTLPPGTYYWRVLSLAYNGDFSAWSKVRIVIVQ